MESQPERALIRAIAASSLLNGYGRRNGVSARKGIDTFSFLNFTIKRFKCRNGALAREGIDTKTESNLVAIGFVVEMEPQPERALIRYNLVEVSSFLSCRNGVLARKGIDTLIPPAPRKLL